MCSGLVFLSSALRNDDEAEDSAMAFMASHRITAECCCASAIVEPAMSPLGSLMKSMPTRGILPKAATNGGRPEDHVAEFMAYTPATIARSISSDEVHGVESTIFSSMFLNLPL